MRSRDSRPGKSASRAANSTVLEKLLASGRATARTGYLIELGPPPGEVSRKLSEALAEERAS